MKDCGFLSEKLSELLNITKQSKYMEYSEKECDITYVSGCSHNIDFMLSGIFHRKRREAFKIVERTKIKASAKRYLKVYRLQGEIKRVDSYVNGRLVC